MTFRFPQKLSQMMGHVVDAERRAASYGRLVDLLRPTFGGHNGAHLRRGGWLYLLADAGEAAFAAKKPAITVQLLNEAWQHVGDLSTDHVKTAKAVAHVATSYTSALCTITRPRGEAWVEALKEAVERLGFARDLVLRQPPSADMVRALVELGLSVAQIWYVRRRHGLVGWLDGEGQRLAALDRAERDLTEGLAAAFSTDAHDAYRDGLPDKVRPAVARMFLDIAGAASVVGQSTRAAEAAQRALELSDQKHHELSARLQLARVELSLDMRIRHYETLIRDAQNVTLATLSDWQKGKISNRIARGAEELSSILYRVKRPTAAWFWKQQARHWASTQTPTAPALADQQQATASAGEASAAIDEEAEPNWAAPETTSAVEVGDQSDDLVDRLERNLRNQHVPAIVLNLMAIVDSSHPVSALGRLVDSVDRWWPSHRRPRPGRLLPAMCVTRQDLARAALELADEFASGYARWLRPDLLNRLARHPDLTVEARRMTADEAYAAAIEVGRWTAAIKAQRVLLAIAEADKDIEAVTAAVTEVCETVQQTLTQARGTADLIDLAHEMTKASVRLAGWLAARGYDSLAFEMAHTGIGVLNRIFLEDARLAEEFELAEQYSTRTPEANARLFALMQERLAAPRTPVEILPTHPTNTAASYGASVAIVQLLDTSDQGSWALGCSVNGSQHRWWVRRLAVTSLALTRLRNAIWFELRKPRRRPIGALRQLYDKIIEPFWPQIAGAEDVVIIPHRGFDGIPVHAALGPTGYLIERCRVSYLPNLLASVLRPTLQRRALVGGWDPAIGAHVEAREVESQLSGLGFEVVRPDRAARGRRHYLDVDGKWDVMHIAAHGDFYPWPASMTSRLRLSASVSLTAGEWLRSGCQAAFVFTNACSVGRQALHAGDLNGFPLALRVRGAVAGVSALSPVPSEPARSFARKFFDSWPGRDSLTAYQQTCRETIARGAPPCDWAPYLHTGMPVHLPSSTMKKPRTVSKRTKTSPPRKGRVRRRR